MRNVLSQAEIDSLLQSLEQGEISTEDLTKENVRVRKYDFRRPNRFSKSNLSVLSLIHDHFARQLANFLTAYLRVPVTAKLATVDQVAFEDLVVSLPAHTVAAVFALTGYGLGIINLGYDLSIPIIDLVCGGSGDVPKRGRPITEIEVNMYRRLIKYILERYETSWKDTMPLSCVLQSLETNPRLIQSIPPQEMVAVVTLSLTINKVQGIISVCLPFMTINSIINKPTADAVEAGKIDYRERWQDRRKTLGQAMLSLTAILGAGEITVQDFLHLTVGDVVAVDKKPGDLVDLLVENRRAFSVQPGVMDSQLAVQVVASRLGGDDELD
ncbi:MAG: Flagellar motor switch protein FliM [Firmicutes bacterium]|nr:Flagellar motor switch protein FliM [candidate division NPL-UPA2 bacterium]